MTSQAASSTGLTSECDPTAERAARWFLLPSLPMGHLLVLGLLSIGVAPGPCCGAPRDRPFDDGWLFHRGEAAGAERPGYDDSEWRRLDLPHDWSIEDAPSQQDSVPQLEVVEGAWRFHTGDNPAWSGAGFDDGDWDKVRLPATWESHSDYRDNDSYGWYRRRVTLPAELQGKDFDLLLGRIDDADQAWFNGRRIGGTGSFPPDYRSAWDVERRYRVSASLVRHGRPNVLAVRVFDGEGEGGVYARGVDRSPVGPFNPDASANKHFTGYTVGGTGWYRKRFSLNETGKRVSIRFDGVYQVAEVWINGRRLGEHTHGYTSFEFDLTPHLNPPGQENLLAVRVRNAGRNSRWYSGSGIYRHAWLTVTDPVHAPTWGVFVTTPEVSTRRAVVKLAVEVANAAEQPTAVVVRARVFDADGESCGVSEDAVVVAASGKKSAECSLELDKPELWSPDSPYLYSAEIELVSGGAVVDQLQTAFGVRSLAFDAENGFRLNGEPLLLRGGCVHHDNGPLGAAAIDRAEQRKVELLKANGFNALRSAHNPPSPALLDACDRLGVLVIDEAFDQWNESKENNAKDHHRFFSDWWERDVASMVRRDRNHPCVIMWSIGNEIPEQFRAGETQKSLREAVLAHDPTRPVTQAICTDWGRVIRDWDKLSDPAFEHLDVAGYNYLPEKYEGDHARRPERVMYGSESFPKDAFEYWRLAEKHSYVIGDFVWTAMDYLGESGLAHAVLSDEPNPFFMSWPWHNAWCGDLDLCGFKKPQSYYRDVVWRRSPIEMTVHAPIPAGKTEVLSWWAWPDEHRSWNWPGHEGRPLEISVYSRCESVRLELNGKPIGEEPLSSDSKLTARFRAPYEPGQLRAFGISGGQVVAETVLETTGPPARLRLTADRDAIFAKRGDLCYVTVEVVDAAGRRVPDAALSVDLMVSGAGDLEGVANGRPNKPASFRAPTCETYRGRCLVILRPSGEAGLIRLSASAESLDESSILIACQ